jgi:hypothetical protein
MSAEPSRPSPFSRQRAAQAPLSLIRQDHKCDSQSKRVSRDGSVEVPIEDTERVPKQGEVTRQPREWKSQVRAYVLLAGKANRRQQEAGASTDCRRLPPIALTRQLACPRKPKGLYASRFRSGQRTYPWSVCSWRQGTIARVAARRRGQTYHLVTSSPSEITAVADDSARRSNS